MPESGGTGYIGSLIARIGLDTTGLKTGAAESTSILRGIEKQVTGLAAGLGALAAGTAAAAALTAVVESGVKFEYQMEKVGGVLRATEKQMDSITDAALEMGLKTEFTASQSGEALENLAKSGFSAEESITALPGVLSLATAASMDLGRSAEIAVGALRSFQLPAQQLSRVNDVLVGAANRTATSIDGLAETMTYAAPVANALGYQIEDLIAFAGALGDRMVQGSMAGTQLSQAMQHAAEVAREHGFASSDLLSVLQGLNEEWANLGKEDRALKFMDAFNERGGRAALILADAIEPARLLREELRNVGGESEELASRMRATTKGLQDTLSSTVEFLQIQVFAKISSQFTDLLTGVNEWLMANQSAVVSASSGLAGAVGGVVAGIAVVSGAAVKSVSELTGAFDTAGSSIDRFFARYNDNLARAEANTRRFSDLVAMGIEPPPLSNWQKLIDGLNNFWQNVGALAQFNLSLIGNVASTIIITVVNFAKAIGGVIVDVAQAATRALLFLHDPSNNPLSLVGAELDQAAGRWKTFWKENQATTEAAVSGVKDAIADIEDAIDLRTPTERFRDDFEKAKGAIVDLRAPTAQFAEEWAKTAASVEGSAGKTADAITKVLMTSQDLTRDPMVGFELPKPKEPETATRATSIGDGRLDDKARELLDATVKINEELLRSDHLTATDRLSVWARYAEGRSQQIEQERLDYLALGGAAETARDQVQDAFAKMGGLKFDVFERDFAEGRVKMQDEDFQKQESERLAVIEKYQSLIDARKALSLKIEADGNRKAFESFVANADSLAALEQARQDRIVEIKSASALRISEIGYEIDAIDEEIANRSRERTLSLTESIGAAYQELYSTITGLARAWFTGEERRQKNLLRLAGGTALGIAAAFLDSIAKQAISMAGYFTALATGFKAIRLLSSGGLLGAAGAMLAVAAAAGIAGQALSAASERTLAGPSGAEYSQDFGSERDVQRGVMSGRENRRVFGASYSRPIDNLVVNASLTINQDIGVYGTLNKDVVRELFYRHFLGVVQEAIEDGAVGAAA